MSTTLFSKQLADSPINTYVLSTDGDENSWIDPSGISTDPAGSNKEVQYNDNGSFGAEAGFEYDSAANLLSVGVLDVNTNITGGANITMGANVIAGAVSSAGQDSRVVSQVANSGGGLKRLFSEAITGAMSGATVDIQVNVPDGARILGVQLRVDTLITGAVAWDAAYITGATQVIATARLPAKNTKFDKMFDTNAATDISSGETDIRITAVGPNFTAGVVRAIVYYEEMIIMEDAP